MKPVVAGTTARASSESVRSIGFSIYYTLVNIGGTLGPIIAFLVRRSLGIENVFRVSALFVLLMSFATLIFYKEPTRSGEQSVPTIAAALRNMVVVLSNLPFVAFLPDFLRLLDRFLAAIHRLAVAISSRIRRPERQDRSFAIRRSCHGNPLPNRGELSHAENSHIHRNDSWDSHRQFFLAHFAAARKHRVRDRGAFYSRGGRDRAVAPIL